ncbi:MAG: response regulator [SAR324 cluster bacterium]|nr:response regulator [SAR324 cluster bacterium]
MIPGMKTQLIYQYVDQKAAIFLLSLDHQGEILTANAYARELVGPELMSKYMNLYEVLIDFGQLPTLKELLETGETPRMLNVKTANGLPQTLYLNFHEQVDEIIVLGQLDKDEVESLRMNLLDANNEANNLSRELQKKNVQLTKLNDLKNQFLGMAAHDLRNPIGIIQQYSEFLLDETKNLLEEGHRDLLSRMKTSSRFMLNLLNDLLDISQIESGKLELKFETIDMSELIKRNISINQVLATPKGIKLSFQPPERLPQLEVDPEKIEQVLNNLLSNAIKYSAAQTTVQINVFQSEDRLVVAILNQGKGIPQEEIPKLFQPFQTTSVKSTAGEKSTGLGLHIVQKIISGHQGKIWVESQLGSDSNLGRTTFFFNLPIPEKELEKIRLVDAEKSAFSSQTDSNIASKYPMKILVVDDDPDQLQSMYLMLKQSGYTAKLVHNNHEMLEALNRKYYQLVFQDINIPDIDGITATRHIKQHFSGKKSPKIVAITGGPKTKEECLQAGMDHFLKKPVSQEDIKAVIAQMWEELYSTQAFTETGNEDQRTSDVVSEMSFPHEFLNEHTIHEYKSIDPGFFNELIDTFLEQTPQLLNDLHQFIEHQDTDKFVQSAEHFRGSSSSIGAEPLAQLCTQMIENQTSGDKQSVQDFLHQLETLFDQTRKSLLSLKQQDGV